MKRLRSALVLGSVTTLAGCHAHYIQATITNHTDAPINVVQVDYPSASFGVQQLAPGATFRYRFKLQGSGNLEVSYLDAHKVEHKQTGPRLNEGQEGQLEITFPAQDHVDFHTSLKP